jgi:myo-inositol-1(or 4)-monophosphatase
MVDPAAAPDWLAACRRIAAEVRAMLDALPGTAQRAVVVGEGQGGDRTLVIDQAAEDIVFAELERLHEAGVRFVAVSEERGEVDFGGGSVRVVIDPVDGSMNAKRGLSPHAVSIAVSDGPTMADVVFAFVCELASGEEWTATRGGGASLTRSGTPDREGRAAGAVTVALGGAEVERRSRRGLLELVAVEAAHPHLVAAAGPALTAVAHRTRTSGSIAWSLCQLAAGRLDGMVTLWSARSVDVAAAQLIARESGALVAFTAFEDPLAAPLDLVSRSPVIAAHTPAGLAELATLPSSAE